MRKFVFFMFVLLILPIKANAVYEVTDSRCTTTLKMSLRQEGQDIVHRISKKENADKILFDVYFYNLSENIYMTDSKDNLIKDGKIENLKPGTSHAVNLYASNKNYCSRYKIATKIITVPYYNPYINSELCLGYEDFELCKKGMNVYDSIEEFKKKREKYILSIKKDDNIIEPIIENKYNIFEFIRDYKYPLVIGLVIILVSLVVIIIRKKKMNRGIL